MEKLYGVPGGYAAWRCGWPTWNSARPPVVQQAVERMAAHGVYGYFGDDSRLSGRDPLVDADPPRLGGGRATQIFTTHGLVNGTGLCIDAFTAPGDGVVLMTPVYHAFARVIKAAGREVVECRAEDRRPGATRWISTPGTRR